MRRPAAPKARAPPWGDGPQGQRGCMRRPAAPKARAPPWGDGPQGQRGCMSSCGDAAPFALRVIGHSMAPEFAEGEVIVVEPWAGVTLRSGTEAVSTSRRTLARLRQSAATRRQMP